MPSWVTCWIIPRVAGTDATAHGQTGGTPGPFGRQRGLAGSVPTRVGEEGLAVKNSQVRGTRDQDSTECGPSLLCLTSQVPEVSGVTNHLAKLSRE